MVSISMVKKVILEAFATYLPFGVPVSLREDLC